MKNLHDFLSAFRVRFLSRCTGRGVAVLVAVLTSDSRISSSPSVKLSSRCVILGERITSGRLRRNEKVPLISVESGPSIAEFPSNCLLRIKLSYVW